MKKELKEFLPLYLGQECIADGNKFTLIGVGLFDTGTIAYDGSRVNEMPSGWWVENCDFKLILRPFDSMTEEECMNLNVAFPVVKKWAKNANNEKWNAEEFLYLIKQGFDLFGLHAAGLCLYRNDKGEVY